MVLCYAQEEDLCRLLPQLDDAEIEVLAESRSARAFMLVGRVAGIFG